MPRKVKNLYKRLPAKTHPDKLVVNMKSFSLLKNGMKNKI